ncbi:MAG: hypothetical protein AB1444_08490 [Spirochaetota bacterium]
MEDSVKRNPFTAIFQKYYEKTMSDSRSKEIAEYIKDFLTINDEEIINDMLTELRNTLTIYTSKLKNEHIQIITLFIDAPDDEYFIPSIVLASAYNSYKIKNTYSIPSHPLLPGTDNLYKQIEFGKNVFSQFGGCDIDMISDILFDMTSLPDIANSELFRQMQTLVIIKILELLYSSCMLLMKGDVFKKLPKIMPFAFFAHLDDKEYIHIAPYD